MTNKIRLSLEDLGVQSFDTTAQVSSGSRGTIHGNAATFEPGADSCHATYCGDCVDTYDACPEGETTYCDSVNIANCQSAFYTDCCGGGGERETTPEGWWNGNCT